MARTRRLVMWPLGSAAACRHFKFVGFDWLHRLSCQN